MPHTKLSVVTVAAVLTTLAFAYCGGILWADNITKPGAKDASWVYRADVDDLRPIARSISLSEERPQDITEEIDYRGNLRRYGQLRHGSENSRRVVIVVDEIGDGLYEFFVDADRDRRVTKDDIVKGTGRTRTCSLETEIVHANQPLHETRRVLLRLSATRTRLGVATLGCIEGHIPWRDSDGVESTRMNVRRIDGNANGLFADARDRLMIDVNHDGRWDRISEQFAYLPVQSISGQRYAVHSDRMGKKFSLSEITGVGQLRVVVA